MRIHDDARRRFVGDIFDTDGGDFNAVTLFGGTTIAWHRHQRQDDHLYVLYGVVQVQAIDPTGKRWQWELTGGATPPLTIPRNWWHGYANPAKADATILQFNSPGKWTGEDEERMSLEGMPWITP